MSVRIAVPSKGRLRDACLDLLDHARRPIMKRLIPLAVLWSISKI